jgi:hypothetical protein
MSHEVSFTPENHGYTIRLVKRSFRNIDGKGTVEIAETVGTLMIEFDKQKAEASFEILNTFIATAVKAKIIPEDAFRYMPLGR